MNLALRKPPVELPYAMEQADCGRCGCPLEQHKGSWRCAGPRGTPMFGGMLDLSLHSPVARCAGHTCSWEGAPTYVDGKPSTHCPACEGFGTIDLRRHALRLHVHVKREGVFFGEPVEPQAQATVERVSRNAPCPCGSGKKWKKCCGC